jgi:hypothetical protein
MRALLLIAMLLSAGPVAAAETAFFDQTRIPDCRLRYAHQKGAFIDCVGGKLAGFLGRYDRQYAGYLICRAGPTICPPEVMTVFGPVADAPIGTRQIECNPLKPAATEPMLLCNLSP